MDGVINATNQHRQSNKKKSGMQHTSNPKVKFRQSSTTKGARSSLVHQNYLAVVIFRSFNVALLLKLINLLKSYVSSI